MKQYYIYLIPYRNAAGEKFYCGYSADPARREKEHDKARFSCKCLCCNGKGLIPWGSEWATRTCPECSGTKRLLNTTSGRVKTGRMHVVGVLDRHDPADRWSMLVSGVLDFHADWPAMRPLTCRKDAMSAERFVKHQRASIKKLAYECGILPEELRAS
jgi:hypothetical protein